MSRANTQSHSTPKGAVLAKAVLVAGLAITLCAAGPAAAGDPQAAQATQDSKAASSAQDAQAPAATQDAQKAAATAEPPKPLPIGAALPMADTKMKNVDGAEVSIAKVRGGKGTLVVFTCNACPWAKAWHSRIVALGNLVAKKGIGVIAINPNDPRVVAEDDFPPMQENAKRSKMAFPYVVDATSDVARAFGATRTPEVFLFDRDGKLVYHGAIDDNAKQPEQVKDRYLDQAVNAVLDGKAVALQETKALGCSIKFRART